MLFQASPEPSVVAAHLKARGTAQLPSDPDDTTQATPEPSSSAGRGRGPRSPLLRRPGLLSPRGLLSQNDFHRGGEGEC